ncbi:MAG: cytochrome P450 [Acidimicrobiaceae bacterium]|nr:cytochrome P450 [Acidimicrobiaceae bacterium]MXZ66642.1 cytochrome P450 [Acidimicrobiaceae bacterium]MYF34211.1 cytochrome P450 [Acidimicrobiaceae bacterium]MYG79121.1 cytochrome P450 [Acidimicrobiaceae bacterium]MYJ30738.1 cytochrome P450 [Acidimicrobiaceae bacterium]
MEPGADSGEMDYSTPPYDQWDYAQPYEQWDHARRHCPVRRQDGISFTDEPAPPGFTLTSWDDADRVLKDWRTFSASINAEVMRPYMGELMLGLDGDEHRRYRNLVAYAFRRSTLERWRSELIEPVIDRLLDAIAPAGRADLVAQVTSRFPVQVICGIVGVPTTDHEQFNDWSIKINYGPLYPEEGVAASQAMRDYLEPLVEARRAEPTGDLLSELVHAEIDGARLTDEKIYGFLRLLLPAGAETTYRAFGSCLLALLDRPEAMARVRADRSLVPAAVEETLRWETSVTMVARRAVADTEIGGCPVPAGSSVSIISGSASHDEARWDDPGQWDLDRVPQQHMAFGTGPHQCLGMHLARMELEAGINAVLDRLPNLRLDPDAERPVISGYAFRGPLTLPVLFDLDGSA